MELNIIKRPVPPEKYGIKCPYSLTPIGITVHNTANSASAANEMLSSSGSVVDAYREDVIVVPTSLGGDTAGVSIPFEVHYAGNRTKGTFDMTTKTFTPAEAE